MYGSYSAMVMGQIQGMKDPAEKWQELEATTNASCATVGPFRKFSTIRSTLGQPLNANVSQLLIKSQHTGYEGAISDIVLMNHIYSTFP